MEKVQKGVREFHEKYGCDTPNKPCVPSAEVLLLRVRLMLEELSEFVAHATAKDLPGMVDSLGDLSFTQYGTAEALGVDMEPVEDEIRASNLTKDGGGKDGGGKVVKGPNFRPPDIQKVLSEQGWNPNE